MKTFMWMFGVAVSVYLAGMLYIYVQQAPPPRPNTGTDVEALASTSRLRNVRWDGHVIILSRDSGSIMHHPDCPCHEKKRTTND